MQLVPQLAAVVEPLALCMEPELAPAAAQRHAPFLFPPPCAALRVPMRTKEKAKDKASSQAVRVRAFAIAFTRPRPLEPRGQPWIAPRMSAQNERLRSLRSQTTCSKVV